MACSSRCRNSKRPRSTCRCSCKGANHGRGGAGSGFKSGTGGSGTDIGTGERPLLRSKAGNQGGYEGSDFANQEYIDKGSGYSLPPDLTLADTDIGLGIPEGINVGATYFRDTPKSHVAEVVVLHQSREFGEYQQVVFNLAETYGLDIKRFESVTGIYQGQLEPSASIWLEGDPETVRKFAATLGSIYDQDGILTFNVDKMGIGTIYRLWGVSDNEQAVLAMGSFGLDGRIEGGIVEIADEDGALAPRIQALAEALGIRWGFRHGHFEMLLKGVHYESRNEG